MLYRKIRKNKKTGKTSRKSNQLFQRNQKTGKEDRRKETQLEELRALRFEPEYYHDYQKMKELDDKIDDVHNEIEHYMQKWEEYSEIMRSLSRTYNCVLFCIRWLEKGILTNGDFMQYKQCLKEVEQILQIEKSFDIVKPKIACTKHRTFFSFCRWDDLKMMLWKESWNIFF